MSLWEPYFRPLLRPFWEPIWPNPLGGPFKLARAVQALARAWPGWDPYFEGLSPGALIWDPYFEAF